MLFDLVVPEWANYISQDSDGAWYAWQERPGPDMSWGIWWHQPTVKTSPAHQNSVRVELVFVGQRNRRREHGRRATPSAGCLEVMTKGTTVA